MRDCFETVPKLTKVKRCQRSKLFCGHHKIARDYFLNEGILSYFFLCIFSKRVTCSTSTKIKILINLKVTIRKILGENLRSFLKYRPISISNRLKLTWSRNLAPPDGQGLHKIARTELLQTRADAKITPLCFCTN